MHLNELVDQNLRHFHIRFAQNSYEFQNRCFHLAFLRCTVEKVRIKTTFANAASFITFQSCIGPSSYSYRSSHVSASKHLIFPPECSRKTFNLRGSHSSNLLIAPQGLFLSFAKPKCPAYSE